MAASNRPLSPHLQVYSPQLTSVLSITHRITGLGLVAGLFLFTWWLWSIAGGPANYEQFHAFITSWPGQIMLGGWLWALCYHLLNGIRHLFWDAGYGFEMKTVYRTGWAVFFGSVFLASLIWSFTEVF